MSERGGKISSGSAGHKCFAIWKMNSTTADPCSHSHHPGTCFGHGHQRRLNLVSGKNSLGSGSYWRARNCSRDAKGAVKGTPGWHSWRPASPPRSSTAFSKAYHGGRNLLHHKIKAVGKDYRFADPLQREFFKVESLFSMSNQRLTQDNKTCPASSPLI